MKKKTLNFSKSTVAQLSNVEQNNIDGAGLTRNCIESRPLYVSCPVICPYTELCMSEPICPSEMGCHSQYC